MALSETARLIAELELRDKFSKNASAFDRAVGGMERRTGTLSRIGSQVSSGLSSATQNLTRIGIAGAGLLAAAVTNGINELARLESATAQTNAVIASTGGVANQTADDIRNLAEKYESLNATIDDKVIQSAENVLLTFTNVREDAFEPALEAALNMNQALGGGEEGLQSTVIQLGKALQDPIRGITALRRVGVNFTEDQRKQIKLLVESNDLYGAQQIILAELATEFGGSFAAAGDTAAGKFARVKDAVEDAQAALATAFLPLLEKVADKLGTFLADPATVRRIEEFGGQLAAGFETVLDTVSRLDFGAIGSALTIAGTGARAVFDAFTGLPPWVQTAVLTGWGLNKLTGGALTGIAGTLTKALAGGIFGTRGATPANPVFVAQVGGIGGVGTVGAGGAGLAIRSLLGITTAVGLGAILGNVIGREVFFNPTVAPAKDFVSKQLAAALTSADPARLQAGIDSIDDSLNNLKVDILPGGLGQLLFGQEIDELQQNREVLQAKLNQVVLAQLGMTAKTAEIQAAIHTEAARTLDTLRGQAGSLIRLEEKRFDPTVNVNVAATANISVSNVSRTLTSFRIAGSTTIGGFTESAF